MSMYTLTFVITKVACPKKVANRNRVLGSKIRL